MKQTLKNEELRHNLYKLLGTVHHLCFLTSGQCLIFDKEGKQIPDLQAEFTSGETNTWLLKLVAEHAEKFTLCKFREWSQEMDKEGFIRVTHLHCNHDVSVQSEQCNHKFERVEKGGEFQGNQCDCGEWEDLT